MQNLRSSIATAIAGQKLGAAVDVRRLAHNLAILFPQHSVDLIVRSIGTEVVKQNASAFWDREAVVRRSSDSQPGPLAGVVVPEV